MTFFFENKNRLNKPSVLILKSKISRVFSIIIIATSILDADMKKIIVTAFIYVFK